MKKIVVNLLALVVAFMLCSCDNTNEADTSRIAELEAQVASLQAASAASIENAVSSNTQVTHEDDVSIIDVEEEQDTFDVSVEILSKTNIPQDIYNYQFSDMVMFSIRITNLSDNNVRGVEGVLNVSDLFGKQFLSIQCDLVGMDIVPNSRITRDDIGMDINQFIDTQVQLYATDFEDLQFEYIISQVV